MKHSWFARLYDPLMAPVERLGLGRTRERLVGDAAGLVLEIGAGTGLNLRHYRRARTVIATEPDAEMLERARRRTAAARVPVRLVLADARDLPFRDGSFDVVVATCVLCTVPEPDRALSELRRVLRDDGELRLMEHVRARGAWAARLQDRLTPAWSHLAGGCCLNRPTLETAERAGFRVEQIETRFGGLVVRARLRPA